LADPAVQRPDLLIIEGTSLGRPDEHAVTEESLEELVADRVEAAPGLVLAAFSPQNIDRPVTFYKATRRRGRQLVIDPYAASLLQSINKPTLPRPNNASLGVFLPAAMRRRLDQKGELQRLDGLYPYRVYPEKIAEHPNRYVLLFRGSMIEDYERIGIRGNTRLFYSQWPGYLDQPNDRIRSWCESNGIEIEMLHTSGHADLSALTEAVERINPIRILPIHTVAPEKLGAIFQNVMQAENGKWIEITSGS
jgi:ribonuclease J